MKKECYGVTIDLERDDLLTDFSRNLLRDYYMNEDEESPYSIRSTLSDTLL